MIPYLAPLLLLMAGASVPQRAAGPEPRAPAAAEGGDFVVYETAPGDTLAGLAEAHFRDPGDWRRARAANAAVLAGLGATQPIAAGTRLRLDTAWLHRTPVRAEIIAFRGDVRVHAGGATRTARIGATLGEGDGIETGAVGFVTLRLPDGSEIALPTSSAIRFDRLRRYSLNGALDRRIRLLSGGASNRVVPLPDPTSRHEVTTPVGVAAVRGTAFRVRYTPGTGRAAAGVLEGRVGVTAGAAAERTLPAGTGLVFSAAGPGPVTRLPAPPVALAMPALQAGLTAEFAVRSEAGLSFRALVATDAAMRDALAEAESADGRFAIAGLPAGRYHLVVTAVTAEGLEGRPAHFRFDVPERDATAAAGGGGAGSAGSPATEPEEPRGAAVAGSLDEGLGEAGRPIAQVFAETFSAGMVEEGDSSEGLEDIVGGWGGDAVALWSLGPGAGPVPAAGSAPARTGGWAGPVALPRLPGMGPARPPLAGLPGPFVAPVVIGAGPVAVPGALPPVLPAVPVTLPAAAPAAALVPEPATWAFLVAGFGLVGLGLRARRAQRSAGGGQAGAA